LTEIRGHGKLYIDGALIVVSFNTGRVCEIVEYSGAEIGVKRVEVEYADGGWWASASWCKVEWVPPGGNAVRVDLPFISV